MRNKIKRLLKQYTDSEGNYTVTLQEFLEEALAAYDPTIKLQVD